MQVASCFVLYSTAFVVIVQLGGRNAPRSITHLTLIAGFASTLFWPLTTMLHDILTGARCLRSSLRSTPSSACRSMLGSRGAATHNERTDNAQSCRIAAEPFACGTPSWSTILLLMLAGFAIEGFVLSAVLVHMVPMTAGLDWVPQACSSRACLARLKWQAVSSTCCSAGRAADLARFGATGSLAAGLAVLLMTAPSISARWLRDPVRVRIRTHEYGRRHSAAGTFWPHRLRGYVGWITAARQFSSAFAPFGLTFMMSGLGTIPALWVNVLIGLLGIVAFGAIAVLQARMRTMPAVDNAALGAEATPI